MSMRICKQLSTGKFLEAQSSATEGTLIKNAVRAGYAENDVRESVVSDAEWAALREQIRQAETTYQDRRRAEYPTIEELMRDLYAMGRFSPGMTDRITAVDLKYPKP